MNDVSVCVVGTQTMEEDSYRFIIFDSAAAWLRERVMELYDQINKDEER